LLRLRASEAGQSLVEFALVAPILLLLILGTVDMARAWNAFQVVTDAAREGARNVVIDDPQIDSDSARAIVENALARARLDPASATISIAEGPLRGDPSTVQIEYPYTFRWIGPVIAWFTGSNQVTLTSTITMRNE
jgi:Flp pilus assembly protein TadG